MRSRAGLISAIVIGAVVVLFGCELRAGSYWLDRQTAKDATVKPVTTATMPREFRGEWCIVDRGDKRSSGTTEFRRGRCPSSDGDEGDLLVDHDGFNWYESRCELVRRILGRSDYAAEFNCEGEGLTTTITYAISVNPRTGRLAMRDVGWYWSWSSENAEDENRRAWAKLDKAHDLKIERCRDGSITFSFPRDFAPDLPKVTRRAWDGNYSVWVKWRGGEPIESVARESELNGSHAFVLDLDEQTVLRLASGGAPMSICAKADGGCSAEVSTLNLVRAVQFVCGGRVR